MSEKIMLQGQGVSTFRKEQGFGDVFRMSLRISKAPAVAGYCYWHLDMNAGAGFNEKADCEGSPLVFMRAGAAARRGFRAYFCEAEPALAARLESRLRETPLPAGCQAHVLRQDNAVALQQFAVAIGRAERRPDLAVGTCLCDPNAVREGFPVEALDFFLAQFKRIDFVLNLNVSVLRRGRGARQRYESDPDAPPYFRGFKDWPDLARDLLPRFHRRHWWIRNPPRVNSDQFTILVGRNVETKGAPFRDFYRLESREGQQILHGLKRVAAGQGFLFDM
jgi:hypothetical protein